MDLGTKEKEASVDKSFENSIKIRSEQSYSDFVYWQLALGKPSESLQLSLEWGWLCSVGQLWTAFGCCVAVELDVAGWVLPFPPFSAIRIRWKGEAGGRNE